MRNFVVAVRLDVYKRQLENIPQMVKASALAPYFKLTDTYRDNGKKNRYTYETFLAERKINDAFRYLSLIHI